MRNFFVKWRVTCDSRASLQTPSGVFLRNTHEVDTYLQRADKKDYRSLGLSHILWLDMSLQQMTSFDEEAFFGNYFSFNILWQLAPNLNRIISSIIYCTKEKKNWEEALKVNVNISRYFPNCDSIIWIEASWSRLVSKINVFQTDVH